MSAALPADIMQIFDLPAELVVDVLQHILIGDVFALRLTNVAFRRLVDLQVEFIAPRVARNTFPGAKLLLRGHEIARYDIR